MKEQKSDLEELIGLKKYEEPEEGFFNDFLQDFQQRQRRDIVEISARALVVERIITAFREMPFWQRVALILGISVCLACGLHVLDRELDNYSGTVTTRLNEDAKPGELPLPLAAVEKDSHSLTTVAVDINFAFIELNQKCHSEDVEF